MTRVSAPSESARIAPARRRSRASGKARIEDVAQLAKVSAQTVSRFYRDTSLVSRESGERISKAADAIG